jgi:8-amino-7-oxononanoate synthase
MECEVFLAAFFHAESALVFNSGYDANIGLFSSIPQRGDTVIYDESIHASIKDGIRLSNAEAFSFKHNDVIDLRRKLEKASGTKYIAIEGLYSMDGDLGRMKEIQSVSDEFCAYLIIDEAHSAGVFGESGKGLVVENGIEDKVFARVVTFGKAYGSHGACVLGSTELTDFLINYARSFIYTTALPPEQFTRIRNAVNFAEIPVLQKKLKDNIQLFRSNNVNYQSMSSENSPIQMIKTNDIDTTKILAKTIQDYKFAVKPIFSPTVKLGNESIRICMHSFNDERSILNLCNLLNEIKI